jgi:hypothetical protein
MTRSDDSPPQNMDANEDFDEQAAERLLAGELGPGDVTAGYRPVATLLAATRAAPSAAEMAGQSETVQAMVAACRSGGAAASSNPSAAPAPTPLVRRRNLRRSVVVAAATLSFGTGLAAAGLLPGSLRSLVAGALPSLGSSSNDSGGHEPGGGSPEDSTPVPRPGGPTAEQAVPISPTNPAQVPGAAPQPVPKVPPGQSKQTARAILQADAAASRGQLMVTFQETGVGVDGVTITARADATATYGCVSGNRNNEKVHREASVEGVSEAGNRFVAVNGTARGTLTLGPPSPAGVTCPAGQATRLLRVRYSKVVLLDTTTGASTAINRTFPTAA